MHWPRSTSAISPASPGRSAASTTSVVAWRSANAVHSRSSMTPPNTMCGFETTGMKRTRVWANIWRRPSAWSLRGWIGRVMASAIGWATRRGSFGHGRGMLRRAMRRREDEVHLAGVEAPGRASAAAQRPLHQGAGREGMPVLRHALAAGDADDLQLVADRRVECRPELDGFVELAEDDAGAGRGAIGDDHVFDRLALRRGIDDEQALD